MEAFSWRDHLLKSDGIGGVGDEVEDAVVGVCGAGIEAGIGIDGEVADRAGDIGTGRYTLSISSLLPILLPPTSFWVSRSAPSLLLTSSLANNSLWKGGSFFVMQFRWLPNFRRKLSSSLSSLLCSTLLLLLLLLLLLSLSTSSATLLHLHPHPPFLLASCIIIDGIDGDDGDTHFSTTTNECSSLPTTSQPRLMGYPTEHAGLSPSIVLWYWISTLSNLTDFSFLFFCFCLCCCFCFCCCCCISFGLWIGRCGLLWNSILVAPSHAAPPQDSSPSTRSPFPPALLLVAQLDIGYNGDGDGDDTMIAAEDKEEDSIRETRSRESGAGSAAMVTTEDRPFPSAALVVNIGVADGAIVGVDIIAAVVVVNNEDADGGSNNADVADDDDADDEADDDDAVVLVEAEWPDMDRPGCRGSCSCCCCCCCCSSSWFLGRAEEVFCSLLSLLRCCSSRGCSCCC
mmetsp:Transcript_2743/g.7643  ORF Transcript_2743/g.7643 Transcript_2743/m.7643 type:complete len:457 (-) Transcript_2743:380-1750(-)